MINLKSEHLQLDLNTSFIPFKMFERVGLKEKFVFTKY